MPRRLAVFGSTGSIGLSTLSVVRNCRELDVEIYALSCGGNWQELAGQVSEFRPERVVIHSPEAAEAFAEAMGGDTPRTDVGEEGMLELAADAAVDIAVMAVVGAAGLRPTIKCLEAGKTVALANKECLVMAGHLVKEAEASNGGRIVPVDSEHSAAFQLLEGVDRSSVKRLIITGSGGALRDVPLGELDRMTPEEALDHPTWQMGPKVTIDSATSMNKALELIEAHWLFGLPVEALKVWVHPQSRVHALLELQDGTLLLHASLTDMRLPIQYALSIPGHLPGPVNQPGLEELSGLTFREPDTQRMTALPLGYRVIREGGALGAVMNAANEVAVEAFLDHRMPFTRIVGLVEAVMDMYTGRNGGRPDLETVLDADRWAREEAARRLP